MADVQMDCFLRYSRLLNCLPCDSISAKEIGAVKTNLKMTGGGLVWYTLLT